MTNDKLDATSHTCLKHPPGAYGCYSSHRCHCDDCLATAQRRRKLVRHGVRQTVPAAIVKQHMDRLGLPCTTIARLSGVSPSTVGEIDRQVRELVKVETARAILAVRPTDPIAGLLPSEGTTRRLQALVAMGHTQLSIAAAIGSSKQHVGRSLRGAHAHVEADFARRVRVAYDQLWATTPPESPAALKSRVLARREGFAPAAAWDDGYGPHGIDNPAATPHPWQRGKRRQTYWEDVLELAELGVPIGEMSDRLGITPAAIERALTRHGRDDLRSRIVGESLHRQKRTAA